MLLCVISLVMGIKILLLLCLTTHISCEGHNPEVYEDEVEHIYNRNENVRTVRNPEVTYRSVYQPPVFRYNEAKQQDYLRRKYLEQQKFDLLKLSNRYPKFFIPFTNPALNANEIYSRVQRSRNDEEVWKPFSFPKTKYQAHLSATTDINKPSLERSNVFLRNMNTEPRNAKISSESPSNAETDDLESEGSEIVEDKVEIDRQDSPTSREQVVYTNQNHLHQHFDKQSQQIRENYDSGKQIGQLGVLNELIGKNPNVQLEGLKRLLQDTPTQNFLQPAVNGPKPFQIRNRTPISENTVDIPNSQDRPNIQVNHADNSVASPQIPQIPHIVDKESFADLQKQFDEASRIQTEQVLARAQQEAQAHVEAQHKAIALAHAQAQKVALENIQKYGNLPSVPDVQQNLQVKPHAAQPLTLVHVQPTILPVPSNKEVLNAGEIQNQIKQQLRQNSPINEHSSQASSYNSGVYSLPLNTVRTVTHNNVPLHAADSKDLLYYAPSHQHHQALVEAQAENVHLAHNSAVAHAYREPLVNHQSLGTEAPPINNEDDGAIGINSLAQPTATTYQHIAVDSGHLEQNDNDDLEDLQYAAKYAFGYKIKDAKEGNDFGHEERRNGKSAEGSYHVLLPDGRLQKVEYYADHSGYHAKVTYEHVAHH